MIWMMVLKSAVWIGVALLLDAMVRQARRRGETRRVQGLTAMAFGAVLLAVEVWLPAVWPFLLVRIAAFLAVTGGALYLRLTRGRGW